MPLSTGSRLGSYEIFAPLGAGGMGEVYRARDPRIGRDVALKVLPATFAADGERQRRFEQEARAAGALNHPNILTIYDVGSENGFPYLVSELLEGETLRARMRERLPVREMIDYAVDIARGLAAAHLKGIVHRDLKPSNVFLMHDGHAKILDFGLAKLTQLQVTGESSPTLSMGTQPGVVLGTVGYMSPEQANGLDVDFRSDQFSFGAMLYEMATGKRAFERNTPIETLAALIREEPAPISELNSQVPPLLRWLIERCLEKDPKKRYGSTEDLARDLETIRIHLAELSGLTKTALPRPKRRRLRILEIAGLVLVASAAAVLGIRWGGSRATETQTIRFLTFSGHDFSPAASPDGRTIAFSSERDGRRRIWLKDLTGGTEVPLTQGGPDDFPRFSPDGSMVLFYRGEGPTLPGRLQPARGDLYRTATVGGEPRKLVEDVLFADWSPDGRQIAFVRPQGEGSAIGIVGTNGERPRQLARLDAQLMHPRWSPDGRTIAAVQQSSIGSSGVPWSIFVVGPEGKGARSVTSASGGFRISSLVWAGGDLVYSQSESVGSVAIPGGTARIVRQSLASGAARTLSRGPHNASVLDIMGAGRVVFDAISNRQNLREFSLQENVTPPEFHWLTRGNSQDRQPVYSPDGERILFTSNRSGNLDLWEISAKTGALHRITDDPADDWDPAFTPDGKQILWSSNRSGHLEIWLAEADGSNARQVSNDGVDAENPTMTRDGRWVIYASTNPGKLGIWKIRPDGSDATRLAAVVTLPEVSPDGLHVVYRNAAEMSLRVVRIADGAVVPFVVQNAFRPRWMPDGRAIAFTWTDEKGAWGVFVQDFVAGRETVKTRRRLAVFDPEMMAESFALSPDGKRVTISSQESFSSLMLAERVPGI